MFKPWFLLFSTLSLPGCAGPKTQAADPAVSSSNAITDIQVLFTAIREKKTTEVTRILEGGGILLDPPLEPGRVNKPLAYAARWGDLESVKVILTHGADINGVGTYASSPLIYALESGNKDIATFLMEQGADVNQPNAMGITPFIGISGGTDRALVQLAYSKGGEINTAYPLLTSGDGSHNSTALQFAIKRGAIESVRYLLENGGDLSNAHFDGKTCEELARENGDTALIELIQTYSSGG